MNLFRAYILILLFFVNFSYSQSQRAKDFLLKNPEDSSLKFSDINKNNFILLHFWSSDDVRSRTNHPDLLKLLEKYKGNTFGDNCGFKVVALGLEKSRQGWLMGLESGGLYDFVNLFEPNGLQSQIAKSFGINKLPYNILIDPKGNILQNNISIDQLTKQLENLNSSKREKNLSDLFAKIFKGDLNNLVPLSHQKVFLLNNKGDTVRVAETDDFGDFIFRKINSATENIIAVANVDVNNNKIEAVYLSQQNGTVLTKIKAEVNQFRYRLLESDINFLSEIPPEEDPVLKINAFISTKEKDILVSKRIFYNTNSHRLDSLSINVVKGIAAVLSKNKNIKMEIYSHTDANGEDEYNLNLSNLRATAVAEAFYGCGIDKSRIVAKGLGETKIVNRCKNGVNCSEKEHELNRRTEFKFIK